jgi:hypothetical protein
MKNILQECFKLKLKQRKVIQDLIPQCKVILENFILRLKYLKLINK